MANYELQTRAQKYTEDFAWKNDFGGGLNGGLYRDNLFAGMVPGTVRFDDATVGFQARYDLKPDGWFGEKSFLKYKAVYGEPDLLVHGIDISGWQAPDDHRQNATDPKEIHYDKMREVGFNFVIVKTCQGVGSVAKHAVAHINNAVNDGTPHSEYTYATPWTDFKNDAVPEVDSFVESIEVVGAGPIKPVLDHESKGYKRKKDGDKKLHECHWGQEMYDLWRGIRGGGRAEYIDRMTDWTHQWLERFESLFGELPMLYSYPSFLNYRIHLEGKILQCKLWLAGYTRKNPLKKWNIDPRLDMVLQQWTSKGDERSKSVYSKGLDLNKAIYGLRPIMRDNG